VGVSPAPVRNHVAAEAGAAGPRVSVVTPVYNSEQFVGRTIASVRAQTLSDWEHILVDDGSTDGSAAVVERVAAEDPRVRLLRQSNAGASVARNLGFSQSRDSEYLLFLDHDDLLEPGMLEELVGYLDQHPDVGAVYCALTTIDEDDRTTPDTWYMRWRAGPLGVSTIPRDDPETPFEAVIMWGGMLPSNTLIRRTAYVQTSGFAPGCFNADTDLFMKLRLVARIHYLDKPLTRYRRHTSQMSVDADVTSSELDSWIREHWAPTDLGPEGRAQFRLGLNARHYGVPALQGYEAAVQRARRGNLIAAARFAAGALRRHAMYLAVNAGLINPPIAPPTGRPVPRATW
jgi:glycosyltransferase involved in cell wall biosynthesis